MPAAARVTDIHVCPKVEPGPQPHFGGDVAPTGEPTVLIGGQAAARKTDAVECQAGPPDNRIDAGSDTVLIGGLPAARYGDKTSHKGVIFSGCPTVRIGNSPQGATLMGAGAPLVEVCEPGGPNDDTV